MRRTGGVEDRGRTRALLVGVAAAKGYALAAEKPVYGVNHLAAHVAVDTLEHGPLPEPAIALLVSGGHSSLLLVDDLASGVTPLGSIIAQDTFQALMHDYDVYARMMHDAVTDIATGLTTNQFNYAGAEAQNIHNLRAMDGTPMPGRPGFHLPPSRF